MAVVFVLHAKLLPGPGGCPKAPKSYPKGPPILEVCWDPGEPYPGATRSLAQFWLPWRAPCSLGLSGSLGSTILEHPVPYGFIGIPGR